MRVAVAAGLAAGGFEVVGRVGVSETGAVAVVVEPAVD